MQVLLNMPPEHQDSQRSGYGQNAWMNIPAPYSSSPQTSMSPMQEFPQFDYSPGGAPMPMEPAYNNVHRPSAFAASHAPMPPPLIMPHSGLWPSMLASHPQQSYSTPVLPHGQLPTPLSASTASDITPTSAKTTTSRRKLTDDERRQMCIEAEQNPNMKQTQIGAKFNVERSTVSKILRQREKYMNPQPKEESTSPVKKSKAKLPDFEKTLTNWVKNQQKKGISITDEDLRKQAQVFSFSRSDQAVVSSTSWLDKFKRKNRLTHLADGEATLVDSRTTSLSQTPVEGSPSSSDGLVSPPASAIDEPGNYPDVKTEHSQELFDYEDSKSSYEHSPDLGQGLEDLDHTSQEGLLSPMSADMTRGQQECMAILEPEDTPGANNRQRSQTFPHVPSFGLESRPSSSGQKAPSLPVRSLSSDSSETGSTGIDPRQMMKRHKSVPDIHYPEQPRYSSMQPPPLPRSADTSLVSNPGSPVEDDNIRALHVIKSLLEQNPGVAEPDDYLAIGKLMSKMKLIRPNAPVLPGGMHPIDIMDSPRISKKRTILGIST